MPNHASVHLIGHLGRDPEFRYLADGTALLKWSLAVSTGWGDKKQTTWWNCTMWGKRTEKLAEMMAKGQAIHVTGEPSLREYEGKDGKRQSLDVRVSDVTLLGRGAEKPATQDEEEVPF